MNPHHPPLAPKSTPPLTHETVALLRRIQHQLDKNPEGFHMEWWHRDPGDHQPGRQARFRFPCNTTHCIAGWAQELTGQDLMGKGYHDMVGVSHYQGSILFHADHWPDEFEAAYRRAEKSLDHHEMAAVAIQRIQHFIDTNGEQ